MQKLAQIKSQTGTQLQQQAEAARTAPAKAAPAAKAEAPKAPEPAKPKAPEAAKPEVAKAAPKGKAKAAPAPPPIETSFVDELLDDPWKLGGTGVAAILLVGYATYRWRRKRNSQFENSIMSVVPSDADSVLGSAGGRNVDTSSSSVQSDFSQG